MPPGGGIVNELIAEKRRGFGNVTSISIPEIKAWVQSELENGFLWCGRIVH